MTCQNKKDNDKMTPIKKHLHSDYHMEYVKLEDIQFFRLTRQNFLSCILK